jgi:hypothetical protein
LDKIIELIEAATDQRSGQTTLSKYQTKLVVEFLQHQQSYLALYKLHLESYKELFNDSKQTR